MYAIVENNKIVEWPIQNLRQKFPQISFPDVITQNSLPVNVVEVLVASEPEYNTSTHKLSTDTPKLISGNWTQTFSVVELSEQELQEQNTFRQKILDNQRAQAYRSESDPLFFKAQRGEATQQQWIDKVLEIKARYPDQGIV